MASPRKIYQPIHASVLPSLDTEYVAFHNTHLKYIQPSETLEWDPAVRDVPSIMSLGASAPLDVASIRDFNLPHCQARAFTPVAQMPGGGWPVCIWFHGGTCIIPGLPAASFKFPSLITCRLL
jgi:hypothetical protein